MPTIAFLSILLCQLLGESITRFFHWSVPGPVLGLLFLFILLLINARKIPKGLETCETALLSHLSLFFVPAGVGVVNLIALLQKNLGVILCVLIFSTVAAIIVGAWCTNKIIQLQNKIIQKQNRRTP